MWTCPRCNRPINHWDAIENTDAGFAHAACHRKPFDVVTSIIAYEQGDLDRDGTVRLFQHLINTDLAWSLQGHYGRTASALIEAGYCTRKVKVS